jgi:hypothetical protein
MIRTDVEDVVEEIMMVVIIMAVMAAAQFISWAAADCLY